MSAAPTLLQIVPTLAGGGLARATLDAAQAVIAAGGAAIVASPGGAMVPDLLRLRATHLELPDGGHPLWGRLMLPGKLASSLSEARVSLIQARSPNTAWVARALARRLGIKWIATLHTPFLAGSIAERFVERRQARADAVVAVSEHVARDAAAALPRARRPARDHPARHQLRPLRSRHRARRPGDQARRRAARARRQPSHPLPGALRQ